MISSYHCIAGWCFLQPGRARSGPMMEAQRPHWQVGLNGRGLTHDGPALDRAGEKENYGAARVTAFASSNSPFLIWRPLIAVIVVSPVSVKLHVPRAPLKLRMPKTASRIAARSFLPAFWMAVNATF